MQKHEQHKRFCKESRWQTIDSQYQTKSTSLFKLVPSELTVEVFRHLDLPARIKLRRVNSHWKHLLLRREVNEIISVNITHFDGCFGEWRRTNWTYPYESPTYLNALLGDHVRCICYDGHGVTINSFEGRAVQQHLAWLRTRSHCVSQVYLRRVAFLYCSRRSALRAVPPLDPNQPSDTVTRMDTFHELLSELWPRRNDSTCDLATLSVSFGVIPFLMFHPMDPDVVLQWSISLPKLTFDWTGDIMKNIRTVSDPFIWRFPPDQLAWMETCIRQLPEKYWERSLFFFANSLGYSDKSTPVSNLINVHTLDKESLVLLARCILHHSSCGEDPKLREPPHAFSEDFFKVRTIQKAARLALPAAPFVAPELSCLPAW